MQDKLCTLCPRRCGIDRSSARGFCGEGDTVRIARYQKHEWEEPPISGTGGSGTVFFTGCTLKCVFCQNYEVSRGYGREVTIERLAEIFLELQDMGCHNVSTPKSALLINRSVSARMVSKAGAYSAPNGENFSSNCL